MTYATATRVVHFLGLADLTADGDVPSFPLGVLYPYSRDLQRVCTCYDAVCRDCPDVASALVGDDRGARATLSPEQAASVSSYLHAIATLHSRIAFAPGRGGESVAAAYRRAHDAMERKPDRQARQPRSAPA
jgi:hypothetical protein